ncbi:MAG: ATP-dependent helicase [Thermoanaerobaculia bacterium]|nr:ATP-dependent helicase [Thermoanaerobaculia bacterium]
MDGPENRAAAERPSETSTPPPDPLFEQHLREALNEAQYRAVTADEGPHLVIAGAGTGKTRALTHRVAWLVQRGIRPESILLLTFTRRASQEMLRRATGLLDERCRRVSGGTFHSFANLILRRYAERLDFHPRFTILDRTDAVDLVGIVRSEAGYAGQGKRFPRSDTLVDLFSKHVNTQAPFTDLLEQDMPQFLDDLGAIEDLFGRYRRRKQEQNVLDYDDLLLLLRDLLRHHTEVRQELAARYRHVLVDEFQDTNRLQAHISALLASVHRNIMAVGDDAQSIYGFRGATVRNILDFSKIFPGAEITKLEQNYRSTQPILDLGNGVLRSAKEGIGKELFSDLDEGEIPTLVRTPDDHGQAEFVARRILELREEGVPLSEIAVLARAAWHTAELELELQQRNIPFRKFGGIRFVEAAHIKDVCALLKLTANPFDGPAWFRALQLLEGIGPKTARAITDHVIERDGDVRVLVQPKLTSRRYGNELSSLSDLLQRASADSVGVSARLEQVLDAYSPWMERKYDDANQRRNDFDSLAVIAGRYAEVESFLADLAIDPPDFGRGGPSDDQEDEWVTLSTVHSAKGLEWHAVFILQMNAGRFPSFQSLGKEADYEEERRLLYVAVTRAKRYLYLMKPEEVGNRYRSYEVGELSPLLGDIRDLRSLVSEHVHVPGQELLQGDATVPAHDDSAQLQRIEDYFAD